MLKLIIENQSQGRLVNLVKRTKLTRWLQRTVKELKQEKLTGTVELNFVDSKHIRKLNKEFRGQDKVTDVLSFSFIGEERFPGINLVGQIFLEPETAKKQAAEHGVDWHEEIEFLFVHALLHIFGYDHENMRDFQKMYHQQLNIMPGRNWENFVRQIFQDSFGKPWR